MQIYKLNMGWPENTDPRSVDKSNRPGPRTTSRAGRWTTYTDLPYLPPEKIQQEKNN